MNNELTVSLPQIPVVKGDIPANLACHLDAVAQSAACGADLVVFPELSLTGYELELLADLALEQEASVFTALSQAAITHNLAIIAGCPLIPKGADRMGVLDAEGSRANAAAINRDGSPVKPAIGAVICFPGGRVEFYLKQYLHEGEERYCESGSEDYLFGLKGYRIALAVCADFLSPEHSRKACEMRADLYIASALISAAGFQSDADVLAGIARDCNVPVMLSNHISQTGGWSSFGHNALWDALGACVMTSESRASGLFVCRFSAGRIVSSLFLPSEFSS